MLGVVFFRMIALGAYLVSMVLWADSVVAGSCWAASLLEGSRMEQASLDAPTGRSTAPSLDTKKADGTLFGIGYLPGLFAGQIRCPFISFSLRIACTSATMQMAASSSKKGGRLWLSEWHFKHSVSAGDPMYCHWTWGLYLQIGKG